MISKRLFATGSIILKRQRAIKIPLDWTYWVGPLWAIPALLAISTRFHAAYVIAGLYTGCQLLYCTAGLSPQYWLPLDLAALTAFFVLYKKNWDVLACWCAIIVCFRILLHANHITGIDMHTLHATYADLTASQAAEFDRHHLVYVTQANILYGCLCATCGGRWWYMKRSYGG